MNPQVTIVIATYNRPHVLKTAIFSVVRQTVQDWVLYVIGDNCNEQTEQVVDEFADDRIKYINLTDRFGEQSGPNSVGIALAQTKYLAFLNHDDIWLQDHLELGLSTLEKSRSNFYLGGIANSAFIEKNQDAVKIHVDHLSSDKRKPSDFFKQQILSYEPASSWIMETALAKRIGYWKYYNEIYRVPIEDYILRAWRAGAIFHFSNNISVWYILTHYQKQKNQHSYHYQSEEHVLVEKLLSTKDSNEIRDLLKESFLEWKAMESTKKEGLIGQTSFGKNRGNDLTFRDKFYLFRVNLLSKLIFNNFSALIYKVFGFDSYNFISKIKGQQKGAYMNAAILKRTGVLPEKPNKEKVIQRVLQEQNIPI